MGYAWDIVIPAGTPEKEAVPQELKLTFGVITKIEFQFPDGCHGLVKCVLTRGGIFRVAPRNPDEWVTGNRSPVTWRTYLVLDDYPTSLQFKGCSPGTTYPHTITVRIELLPAKVASMMPLVELMTQIARRLRLI